MKRGGWQLLMLDMETRRVAWHSKVQGALLHWTLFRVGPRYYLSRWNRGMAVFSGTTGKLEGAIKIPSAWSAPGPRPHRFGSDNLWIHTNRSWGVLDGRTLKLKHHSGKFPPLEDGRALFRELLGKQAVGI